MIQRLKELWKDDSGISAVEYALMAAGIALAIVTVVSTLGETINDKFQEIVDGLNGEDTTEEP